MTNHVNATLAAATAVTSATTPTARRKRRLRPATEAAAAVAPSGSAPSDVRPGRDSLAIQRSSSATSCAVSQRPSGCFARHFLTSRSREGGVSGCAVAMLAGSAFMMLPIKLTSVSPTNARLPVTIS